MSWIHEVYLLISLAKDRSKVEQPSCRQQSSKKKRLQQESERAVHWLLSPVRVDILPQLLLVAVVLPETNVVDLASLPGLGVQA